MRLPASMARNRYTFAAAAAKKEGYPVLELLFHYTAGQEKEHGRFSMNICAAAAAAV